jgi:hypothetical protein
MKGAHLTQERDADAGSCDDCNELPGSIKCRKTDYMSNYEVGCVRIQGLMTLSVCCTYSLFNDNANNQLSAIK